MIAKKSYMLLFLLFYVPIFYAMQESVRESEIVSPDYTQDWKDLESEAIGKRSSLWGKLLGRKPKSLEDIKKQDPFKCWYEDCRYFVKKSNDRVVYEMKDRIELLRKHIAGRHAKKRKAAVVDDLQKKVAALEQKVLHLQTDLRNLAEQMRREQALKQPMAIQAFEDLFGS